MAIDILYEDDVLIAAAKPSGQLVIPGRGEISGLPLAQELEAHFKKKIFVVHRLDRGASGIVLFAKTAATHRTLSLQFEKRDIEKTYLVLAQGAVTESGRIETPIKVFGSGRMGVHPAGKPSLTEYKPLKPLRGSTLLEVSPHTGRRHQIRVHLYSIGHPVMGDTLYGKERPVGGCARLMLHAWKIAFTHKGKRLALEAPAPEDFNSAAKPAEEA